MAEAVEAEVTEEVTVVAVAAEAVEVVIADDLTTIYTTKEEPDDSSFFCVTYHNLMSGEHVGGIKEFIQFILAHQSMLEDKIIDTLSSLKSFFCNLC